MFILGKFYLVIFSENKKGMIIVSTIKEAEELADFFNEEEREIHFEALSFRDEFRGEGGGV